MDQFSDGVYVRLMANIRKEQIFAGKILLELWESIFKVPINRHHAENGRFYEQLSMDTVKKYNQTINFYSIISHEKITTDNQNTQTLTLGS